MTHLSNSKYRSTSMITTSAATSPYSDNWPAIRAYISDTWNTLTRGPETIKQTVYDGMLEQYVPVYVAFTESPDAVRDGILAASDPDDNHFAQELVVHTLPPDRKFGDVTDDHPHGLLYVPGKYVVPGGRFNELYGWDSYFIVEGLLRDGRYDLAASITDAQLYEVDHYGTVLNANRTYFLTRSQPPLLNKMVLALHQHQPDLERLERAVVLLEQLHHYWQSEPNLDPGTGTGLSRYHDRADGPSDEVIASERDDAGRTHYERLAMYFARNLSSLQQQVPDLERYYDVKTGQLTDEFYKGDRAMRESGFDPSNRFGPFSGACHQHLPVCLNSLLYALEKDLATIHQKLGNSSAVQHFESFAASRRSTMQELFWNKEQGCFQDWDLIRKDKRDYPFLTMFYPLWTGWATAEQAEILVEKHLPKFLRPGGLVTSLEVTGNQWDAPFGWAPLHLAVIEGLQRYGFTAEADVIRQRFLGMIHDDFARCGTLLEKYDVEICRGKVADHIDFGYSENQIGFGWTNGVVLMLLEDYDEAGGSTSTTAPTGSSPS